MTSLDSFKARRTLTVGSKTYDYFSLPGAEANGLAGIAALPVSMKVLLENLLRFEDGRTVTKADIEAVAAWAVDRGKAEREIAYRPARVLMQDFTGVPAVVDLAAMRDAMRALGGDPARINPLVPVDLVIDHSVVVDYFGSAGCPEEECRARIRAEPGALPLPEMGPVGLLQFPRRAAGHRHLPPGQPRISRADRVDRAATRTAPSSLIPTRWSAPIRHTTMVNGLGVLGWGVGGIEAEAAMLGQPISMLIPEVVGFRLTGKLRPGVTATDLVLTVTQMLRKKGVVGKFVEFYGAGLDAMTLEDKATIGNMAPEYGATCGFFPVDAETLRYLDKSGRTPRAHRPGRGLFARAGHVPRRAPRPTPSSPTCSSSTSTRSSPRSPARSARRIACCSPMPRPASSPRSRASSRSRARSARRSPVKGYDFALRHGAVTIAAITSCTNTSNPSVLVAAGLLARKARAKGLHVEALGQDLARARLAGRPGIPDPVRPAGRPRRARLQPRRLRLHHLHRQFRPAARADLRGRQRGRPRRRRRPLGQPQFRGPRQPGRQGELPRLAAARGRLRPRRLDADRPVHASRSAWARTATRSISPTSGRARTRSRRSSTNIVTKSLFTVEICRRLQGRRELAGRSRRRPARPMPGTATRPMCRTRLISSA